MTGRVCGLHTADRHQRPHSGLESAHRLVFQPFKLREISKEEQDFRADAAAADDDAEERNTL